MNENSKEDVYELWLRYREINNPAQLSQYQEAINNLVIFGDSETIEIIRSEIARAIPTLLGQPIPTSH